MEEEDTHEPSTGQPATELPVTEPEQPTPVTEPEQSTPVTEPEQSTPVTEPATQQSAPGPSRAKKRKLTKADKAEKEVSTTLSKLAEQGEDLKKTLILLDEQRAKREAEAAERENRGKTGCLLC